MSQNKNKSFLLLFFLTLAIAFVSIECKPNSNAAKNDSENRIENSDEILKFVSNVQFPSQLDFCGESVPLKNPEVRERAEREFYLLLQQPGQLVLYLKRSGKYFPIYERILAENNLPEDLKYLSVAESALFQSRSAKNAFGLWQFMEGTAKTYNLRVDELVDERCHFEKSTAAALKYLKNGKDNFGSWTLAAAGYNMGNTGVRSALNKQSVNNYYDLYLNEETSRFVFRIIMIKELMKNSHKYGLNISQNEKYSFGKTKNVQVKGAIDDLAKWAKDNNTTYKNVKLLNPWILKDKLPPGDWEILVAEN